MRTSFQVEQIDHVELFVPDRYVAAEWYRDVLGLRIVEEYEYWAEDPNGPLMISTPGGGTKLALFVGEPQRNRETAGYHLVAFRVSGEKFLEFLESLPELNLFDHMGRKVTRDNSRDHQSAFSIYFTDPFGHRIEITTYEHEIVRAALS